MNIEGNPGANLACAIFTVAIVPSYSRGLAKQWDYRAMKPAKDRLTLDPWVLKPDRVVGTDILTM